MQKGGNGDGVSHTGDDGDPEVTDITRRYDSTGDTLGAINELEQLLIQRTGQIPVVSPELLAAHAARIAQADAAAADAREPEAQAQAQASEPDGAEESPQPAIDWSIVPIEPLEPAPWFSDWIDPEKTAAAFDARAATEFTDVSTKVFAVFSADPPAVEAPAIDAAAVDAAAIEAPAPEVSPEPEPEADPARDDATNVPAHDADELDGIDDPVHGTPPPAPAPIASSGEPSASPPVTPPPAAPAPLAPGPDPAAAPKRRLWPFGRR